LNRATRLELAKQTVAIVERGSYGALPSAARNGMSSSTPSETFLVPRPAVRRNAVLFGLLISVVVLVGMIPRVKEWDLVAVLDIACILGLVWAMALTESHVLYWLSKRRWQLHVGSEGVCIEQGASRQLVPWTVMTQVVVHSEAGVEHRIDIYTAEGRDLELKDFERLPEIAKLIKAGVPPKVTVTEE
jgi:hypothetical protein